MSTAARIITVLLVLALLLAGSVAARADQVIVRGDQRQLEVGAWALDRFTQAGLTLPDLTIAFHDDPASCRGDLGVTYAGGPTTQIHICRRPGMRRILLHELAHAWTDHHLDRGARDAYIAHRGESSWNEGDWYHQASEQAAETITWAALEGRLLLREKMPNTHPDQLRPGYQLLTGMALPEWDGDPDTPFHQPPITDPEPAPDPWQSRR